MPRNDMAQNETTRMHSDAWWQRAIEGALSRDESRRWQRHLKVCEACRREWQALAKVDRLLRTAPPVPQLSEDFTQRTVAQVVRRQRWRRLLSYVVGTLIVALVTVMVYDTVSSTFASLERTVSVLLSSWQLLFSSLMRTSVDLIVTGKAIAPLLVAMVSGMLLFLMPNGALATMMFVWFSRRGRASSAAQST
jgi:anti-sigma factor RsiW